MFINFSNHPSDQWPAAQREAASAYGEIADIPFPAVPPDATADEVSVMADKYVKQILQLNPGAVMCQGEFTLAFYVVAKLKSHGIPVLAACTERKAAEVSDNGVVSKTSVFEFVQFREYIC